MSDRQKFDIGDCVRLTDKFPVYMKHFKGAGELAVVLGSYSQMCRNEKIGGINEQYCLYFPSLDNKISWYQENMLTLIKKNQFLMLPEGDIYRNIFEAGLVAREDF